MYPRPRARGKQLDVPHAEKLAEECKRIQAEQRAPPVAIVSGHREWVHLRRQVAYGQFSRFYPGGEETFAGVPVVISRFHSTPQIVATPGDMEDVMLEGRNG